MLRNYIKLLVFTVVCSLSAASTSGSQSGSLSANKCYHKSYLAHGHVTPLNDTHGTVRCLQGYTRNFVRATVRCNTDGARPQWTFLGSQTCAVISCPASVPNARFTSDGGITYGKRRTIRCELGYTAMGETGSIVCIQNGSDSMGVWHGMECRPLICPEPLVAGGGHVHSTAAENVYGTRANASCDATAYSSYVRGKKNVNRPTLNGQVTCELNDDQTSVSWKGFTCGAAAQGYCYGVHVENGHVTTTNGQRGMLTCTRGYTQAGQQGKVTCTYGDRFDKSTYRWEGFTCGRLYCDSNGIKNGRFSNPDERAKIGDTRTVVCDDGYTATGKQGIVTCIGGPNLHMGTWHGMECKPVVCSDSHLVAGNATMTVGQLNDRATVHCDIGRRVALNDLPVAQCVNANVSRGAWQYNHQSCLDLVRCVARRPKLGHVIKPQQNSSDQSCVTVRLNEEVKLACINGTRPTGNMSAICGAKGQFSPQLGDCEDIDECLENPCGPNADCENTIGSYICNCHYGYWKNPATSRCEILQCQSTPLQNGIVKPNTKLIDFDQDVEWACNSGYVLHGSYNATCLVNCTLAYWSDAKPVCQNKDECVVDQPCHDYAICVDTVGSYNCSCRTGFTGNGAYCEDIDECEEDDICPIDSECANTIGSFHCFCPDGFSSVNSSEHHAGFVCHDINECSGATAIPNLCGPPEAHRRCINTHGSHNCSCKEGYNEKNATCDPISCTTPDVEGLEYEPSAPVYPDQIDIRCLPGFVCEGDLHSVCDESGKVIVHVTTREVNCTVSKLANGFYTIGDDDEEIRDRNSVIRYQTEAAFDCDAGYYRVGTCHQYCQATGVLDPELAPVCHDLNECANDTTHDCHENAYCVNTNGSYHCVCEEGYEGNGFICHDINECLSDPCEIGARCENTPGSHKCPCETGFEKNATTDRCEFIQCPVLHLTYATPVYTSRRCAYNTCITYNCNEGHVLSDGITTHFQVCCQADRSLTTPAVCYPVQCPVFETANCTHRPNTPHVNFNASVTYTCNKGFRMKNAIDTLFCEADTTFDNLVPQCEDIHECNENPHLCGANQECINTEGSYTCRCIKGFSAVYENNTLHCEDDDECATRTHDCREHSTCRNIPGRYRCPCDPNYVRLTPTGRCQPERCNPAPIANGFITPRQPVYGDNVQINCNDGYRVTKAINATCFGNGGIHWGTNNTNAPSCTRITCSFHLASHVKATPAQKTVEEGTTVQFHCEAGYLLNGASVAGCTKAGVLNSSVPTCDIVTCAVEAPKHGSVTPARNARYGQNITYACDAGYVMHGRTGPNYCIQTHEDCTGELQYEAPTCEDKNECDEFHKLDCHNNTICKNTNGSYQCYCPAGFTGNATHCEDIQECTLGTHNCHTYATCTETPGSCQCECNPGYRGDGHNCTIKRCPSPSGPHVVRHPSSSTVTYNQTITYSCQPGYIQSGVSQLLCQANETLNGNLPTCSPVNCTTRVMAHSIVSATQVYYGQNITYTCAEGYYIQGESLRNCTASGTLDGQLPTCTKCAWDGADLPGSMFIFDNGSIRCEFGYYPAPASPAELKAELNNSGPANAPGGLKTSGDYATKPVCSVEGKWINTARCTPCRLPADSDQHLRISIFGIETCVPGYELEPSTKSLTCVNGYWRNTGTCQIVQCPVIAPRAGVTVPVCTHINFGETVGFACDEGHDLIGAHEAMCLANKTLSHAPPHCEIRQCLLYSLENGLRVPGGDKKYINYLEKVAYFCDLGYKLVGEAVQACTAFSALNGSQPSCQDRDECVEDKPCAANARCTNTAGNHTCTCNEGFTGDGATCEDVDECLISPPVCTANSHCTNLIGSKACPCNPGFKWNNGTRTCDQIFCPVPEPPKHCGLVGIYTPQIRASERITWQCDHGHHYNGQRNGSVACKEDGSVTMIGECQPCAGNRWAGNGSVILDNGTVTCRPGYYLLDYSPPQCRDGVWDEVDPCARCHWADEGRRGYRAINRTTGDVTCAARRVRLPHRLHQPACISGHWTYTARCINYNKNCGTLRYLLAPGSTATDHTSASAHCSTLGHAALPSDHPDQIQCAEYYLYRILSPKVNYDWLVGTYSPVQHIATKARSPYVCLLFCDWCDHGREGYLNIDVMSGVVNCQPGYARIQSAKSPVCRNSQWKHTATCTRCAWPNAGSPDYASIDQDGTVQCAHDCSLNVMGTPHCSNGVWQDTAECIRAQGHAPVHTQGSNILSAGYVA